MENLVPELVFVELSKYCIGCIFSTNSKCDIKPVTTKFDCYGGIFKLEYSEEKIINHLEKMTQTIKIIKLPIAVYELLKQIKE